MIEFNYPAEKKWQKEGQILTFNSYRDRVRLYPLFFIYLKKIEICGGNHLENIIMNELPPEFSLDFKNENHSTSSLQYYQKADIFRKIKISYERSSENTKDIIHLNKKFPGIYKFEIEYLGKVVSDGLIRDIFPYETSNEIRIGKRDFSPTELMKYPISVLPFRYSNLIKQLIPNTSIVTNNKSIVYEIILNEEPKKMSASVKCGDITDKNELFSDYYDPKKITLNIIFTEFGLHNCLIWINGNVQCFFHILYSED